MAHDLKDIEYVGDSRVKSGRTPNIPRDYDEFPGKTEAFMPDFLLKEWMVGAVFLVGFMLLVIIHPAPLEPAPADPTDSAYTPLPDWYFLFLYQLLKFFPGQWVILGTVVIPGIAGLALLLAPWLDRSKYRRPHKRPIATGLMLFSLAGIFFLTWQSLVQHEAQAEMMGGGQVETDAVLVAPDDPSMAIFQSQPCASCHGSELEGTPAGPTLLGVGDRLTAEEIHDVIENGRGAMPAGLFSGSPEELDQLVQWLALQKAESGGEETAEGH